MKKHNLISHIRAMIRQKQYSYATEKNYVHWIKRYIRFHKMKHPVSLGEKEITDFLSYLANSRNVSASTQNQALNAIVFLYRDVLKVELGDFSSFQRAKAPKVLPTLISDAEVRAILRNLDGTYKLMACLLYGSGLRLKECLRLRIKDVDFDRNQLWVRQSR